MNEQLRWKKFPVLNDGFICLVDSMGDDSSIVQAARVSYGRDARFEFAPRDHQEETEFNKEKTKDRQLIRYLLNHSHTTPFEMVEFKFLVRVPMDCWRQWIRHRTASVNEYSTRYTEAIDSQQTTSPQEWRLQATDNKQGSSGFLEEWPEGFILSDSNPDDSTEFYALDTNRPTERSSYYWHDLELNSKPGEVLSELEVEYHKTAKNLYEQRLRLGVAKEQARKDLPLSTYTEAYWKCDLHNIFNFLRLRMDSHAQYEIRMYANAMAEIVKQIVPVAWEAFEDYVLHAKKFSRMEMELLRQAYTDLIGDTCTFKGQLSKPTSMSDREWKAFLEKLA